MAIKLIANYSKRLGLPGYSSHQFEVSIETEIGNTSELDFAAERPLQLAPVCCGCPDQAGWICS